MKEKKWYQKTHKGFIGDIFIIFLFFILVPSVVLMAFYTAGTLIQANLQGMADNGLINQGPVNLAAEMFGLLGYFDYIIPFIVLGAAVAVFVYAAFLNASRILLGVGFVLMIILTYVSFYLSNAFYTILTNPVLINATGHFPNIVYIIDYMPVLVAVLTIVYLLIATTKLRSGSFSSGNAPPMKTTW